MKIRSAFVLMAFTTLLSSCATAEKKKPQPCRAEELTLGPSDFKVTVEKYVPTSSGKSLLILPPTGGANVLDRGYAKKFCAQGYEVYIVKNWTGDEEKDTFDLRLHQRLYEKSIRALDIVTDQINTGFIGALGTSVGATYLAVASNFNEKINAIFTIAGGAPITEVIVRSDHRNMKELKKERFKRFGFKDDQDYLAALKKEFLLEPMQNGERYKTKIYGMILAENDKTVPTANQKQLQDFWGPAFSYTMTNAHLATIIKSRVFHSTDILDFFERAAHKKTPPGGP